MERGKQGNRTIRNLILTGAAIAFAALAVLVCLLLRPKTGAPGTFVIHYGNGETLTVPAYETRTIVIRDGKLVRGQTGEGEENVIRIENGEAWMLIANCPHGECRKQGVLNAETVRSRPLGTWVVCAPHRVYIEYRGDGA